MDHGRTDGQTDQWTDQWTNGRLESATKKGRTLCVVLVVQMAAMKPPGLVLFFHGHGGILTTVYIVVEKPENAL